MEGSLKQRSLVGRIGEIRPLLLDQSQLRYTTRGCFIPHITKLSIATTEESQLYTLNISQEISVALSISSDTHQDQVTLTVKRAAMTGSASPVPLRLTKTPTVTIPKSRRKIFNIDVRDCCFNEEGNYFLTCTLDWTSRDRSGTPTDKKNIGATFRTEVSSYTKTPDFKNNNFQFRINSTVSTSPTSKTGTPDPFNSPKLRPGGSRSNLFDELNGPSIILEAFQVVEGSKNDAFVVGACRLSLSKFMGQLLRGEQLPLPIRLKRPLTNDTHDTPLHHTENDGIDTLHLEENPQVLHVGVANMLVSILENSGPISAQSDVMTSLPFHNDDDVTPCIHFTENFTVSDVVEVDKGDEGNALQGDTKGHTLEGGRDGSKYSFEVTVHCLVNLPTSEGGKLFSPFFICKTTKDARMKKPAKAATFAVENARHAIWREKLVVDAEYEEVKEGLGLFLAIIDSVTRKYIGKCIVPVDNLVFGEQYNLGILINRDNSFLIISLCAEYDPRDEIYLFQHIPDLLRLKIFLRGFQRNIVSPGTTIIAVVKMMEDVDVYRRNISRSISQKILPSQPFNTVALDSPDPFGSLTPTSHRVTVPSEDTEEGTIWNETIQFTVHKDKIVPKKSVFAIEYYSIQHTSEGKLVTSDMIHYVGYSILYLRDILDPEVPEGVVASFADISVTFSDRHESNDNFLHMDALKFTSKGYIDYLQRCMAESSNGKVETEGRRSKNASPNPSRLKGSNTSTPEMKRREQETKKNGTYSLGEKELQMIKEQQEWVLQETRRIEEERRRMEEGRREEEAKRRKEEERRREEEERRREGEERRREEEERRLEERLRLFEGKMRAESEMRIREEMMREKRREGEDVREEDEVIKLLKSQLEKEREEHRLDVERQASIQNELVQSLRTTADTLRIEIESQKRNEQTRASTSSSQIADLISKNQTLTREIEELKHSEAKESPNLRPLEFADDGPRSAMVSDDITALRRRTWQQMEEITKLKEELEEMRRYQRTVFKQEEIIGRLNSHLQTTIDDSQRERSDKEVKHREIQRLLQVIGTLETRLSQLPLEKEKENELSEIIKQKEEQLSEILKEKENQLNELQRVYTQEKDSWGDEKRELTKARVEMERSLEENNKEIEEKNKEIEEKNKEIEEKNKEIGEKRKEIEETNKMIEETNKRIIQSNETMGEKMEAIESMEREREEKERKMDDMQKKMEQMKGEKSAMEEKMKEMQKVIDTLRSEQDKKRDRIKLTQSSGGYDSIMSPPISLGLDPNKITSLMDMYAAFIPQNPPNTAETQPRPSSNEPVSRSTRRLRSAGERSHSFVDLVKTDPARSPRSPRSNTNPPKVESGELKTITRSKSTTMAELEQSIMASEMKKGEEEKKVTQDDSGKKREEELTRKKSKGFEKIISKNCTSGTPLSRPLSIVKGGSFSNILSHVSSGRHDNTPLSTSPPEPENNNVMIEVAAISDRREDPIILTERREESSGHLSRPSSAEISSRRGSRPSSANGLPTTSPRRITDLALFRMSSMEEMNESRLSPRVPETSSTTRDVKTLRNIEIPPVNLEERLPLRSPVAESPKDRSALLHSSGSISTREMRQTTPVGEPQLSPGSAGRQPRDTEVEEPVSEEGRKKAEEVKMSTRRQPTHMPVKHPSGSYRDMMYFRIEC
ncbi:trichohyalin [Planoprotostelium fungivorum]|uniref:Trichohyalin n=1 Tax=Planoprotostelium fungivorum TaxID=1890364 RepID=A0A2P6MSG5_9EUKA|nr:trichohyalin [Planoprotostelium fungivorum]